MKRTTTKAPETGLQALALVRKHGADVHSGGASKYDAEARYGGVIAQYGSLLRALKTAGFDVKRKQVRNSDWHTGRPVGKPYLVIVATLGAVRIDITPNRRVGAYLNVRGPKPAKYNPISIWY